MAAQSLGSLFVTLDAKTTGLVKGLSQASGMVDKFTKEVKKLAADVSQTATAITALGIASVAMSAQVDSRTNASLTRVTRSVQLLATQVADLLAPAMRTLADTFRRAADAIASLDPETKKQISQWAIYAVQIGLASKVLGTVFGLLNGLAGAFEFVGAIIAGVGVGSILSFIAAAALLIVSIVFLHKVVRENLAGVQEIVRTVAEFFGNAWAKAVEFASNAFSNFVDTLASMMKAALGIMAQIADATGSGAGPAIRIAMGVVDSIAKDLKSGATAKKFVLAAAELGKKAAKSLVEEFKIIAKELGLSGMFDKMLAKFNGKAGSARQPFKPGGDFVADWYAKTDFSDPSIQRRGSMGKTLSTSMFADQTRVVNARGTDSRRLNSGVASMAGGEEARRNFEALQSKAKAEAEAAAVQAAADTKQALAGIAQNFVGKLGKMGGMINEVISAAQAGGPWAALAAAILGLLSETEAFGTLLSVMSSGLKILTDALAPAAEVIVGVLVEVLVPVFQILAQAITMLVPVLKIVIQFVRPLLPIFALLGYLLGMLTPLINFLVVILKPILDVFTVLVRVLFEVVRVIFGVVGAIATGVVAVWNTLMDAIGAIVDTVVAILTLGAVTNAGDFARKGKASTKAFDDAMRAMSVKSYEDIQNDQNAAARVAKETAAAENKIAKDNEVADAAGKAADSLETFSESFLNVPSGYKVSSARYSSTAESGMGYGGSGGSGGGQTIVITSMNVLASDPARLAAKLEAMKRARYFEQTGSVLTSSGTAGAGVGALR